MTTTKCFLCYSSSYQHLKDPIRRLLEELGFERPVDVFDGPEIAPLSEAVIQKIHDADAVVVLYGPNQKPTKSRTASVGASWPTEEALLARGMAKPIALIIHEGTQFPGLLAGHSTPPHFDFWDSDSFLSNVHNIVSYLLAFKERLQRTRGTQPFWVRKVVARRRILSAQHMRLESYNEVVARQSCTMFKHSLSTSDDKTVALPPPEQIKTVLEKRLGPESLKICLRFGRRTDYDIEYIVEVSPSLEPGQELGYWRSFELPNILPLTRSEIAARSQNPEFPKEYGAHRYGLAWEVISDIEMMTVSVHFPREVALASHDVLVLHSETYEQNKKETERCRPFLRLKEELEGSERVLEMAIPQPLLLHSYHLVYEPRD
jgi:hypothetical protein